MSYINLLLSSGRLPESSTSGGDSTMASQLSFDPTMVTSETSGRELTGRVGNCFVGSGIDETVDVGVSNRLELLFKLLRLLLHSSLEASK